MIIVNCLLRDDLVERARAGDAEALDLLIRAVPRDMPSSIRLAERDRRIRRLVVMVSDAIPSMKPTAILRALDEAAGKIACGGRIGGALDGLSAGEKKTIAAEIDYIRRWATWPKYTQLFEITR